MILRGRRVRVRALTKSETDLTRRGALGARPEGDGAAVRAWEARVLCAEVALAMDLDLGGGLGPFPGPRSDRAGAWLAAAAERVADVLAEEEIPAVWGAAMGVLSPRKTVGLEDLERDAEELAAAAEATREPRLAGMARALGKRITRLGLPESEERADAADPVTRAAGN